MHLTPLRQPRVFCFRNRSGIYGGFNCEFRIALLAVSLIIRNDDASVK